MNISAKLTTKSGCVYSDKKCVIYSSFIWNDASINTLMKFRQGLSCFKRNIYAAGVVMPSHNDIECVSCVVNNILAMW